MLAANGTPFDCGEPMEPHTKCVVRPRTGSTSKAALSPECPMPSSARRVRLVAGCWMVILPAQRPLTKLPEFVGLIGTVTNVPTVYRMSTKNHCQLEKLVGKPSPYV